MARWPTGGCWLVPHASLSCMACAALTRNSVDEELELEAFKVALRGWRGAQQLAAGWG